MTEILVGAQPARRVHDRATGRDEEQRTPFPRLAFVLLTLAVALVLDLPVLADDHLYSADEVAVFLGVDRRRVYGLRDSGDLVAHRIGKRTIRFAAADVLRLLEAGRDEEWPS